MTKVAVSGALGRMGSETVRAVEAVPDLELVARIDPGAGASAVEGLFADLEVALTQTRPEVLVDFTRPDAVEANIRTALAHGVNCVIGTTGLSPATLAALEAEIPAGVCLFVAPNFAIGAVLLMQLAQYVAPYMPQAEVIELHHDKKLDAPSGTALRTARLIAQARGDYTSPALGKDSELPDGTGARGANIAGVPVHSVRLEGFVASQEVIFGGQGQTLTIRHDSTDRTSFMPGVVLACRAVVKHQGLVVGLEHFLGERNE